MVEAKWVGLPPEVVEPLFDIFKYMCTILVTVKILIGTFHAGGGFIAYMLPS